jgi:hypothetical protein
MIFMKNGLLTLIMTLAVGLACGSAQAQRERDEVAVLHHLADTEGTASVFDADLSSSTPLVDRNGIMHGGHIFDGTGQILVQPDDWLVTSGNYFGAVNDGPDCPSIEPNNNADFGLRDSTHANLRCPQGSCSENGHGSRILTLTGFSDGRVFFGGTFSCEPQNGRSASVRHVTTDQGGNMQLREIHSGPGQFGDWVEDEGISAAVVSGAGDLYFTYKCATLSCADPLQPTESQGRIRRLAGGLLSDDQGPDEGLGASAGNPIVGLHLDKLSDETLVLATDDRHIQLRDPTTLSPTGVTAGAFGTASATISGIGVLSDDRVVVVTDEGEILLRDTDLTSLQLQTVLGAALGTHEITAMGVASDDDVVVGTAGGILLRFSYDSGAGTLTQQGTELTGLGRVADIDFFNGPPPTGACNLTGICEALTEADCLAQGGTYEGDDTLCPAILNIPGDCNQDGTLDLSDVVHLLGFLFQGTPADLPCSTEAANLALLDCNQDGGIDLSDAVYKLAFLFQGGPPPDQGSGCTAIVGCPQNQSCP